MGLMPETFKIDQCVAIAELNRIHLLCSVNIPSPLIS